MPWIHGDNKFTCHIKLPILFGEYLFIKTVFIIEDNSKQLSILPNDVKLRINAIEKPKTDYILAKNIEIYSVANTINKFQIHSDFQMIYKQNFYYDKQDGIDTLLDE